MRRAKSAWTIGRRRNDDAWLAVHLSHIVGSHVVDRTGLPGGFDFDLKWTPNPIAPPDPDVVSAGDGPSIFTALQEQLGLRMERTRGPLDVLVVDRVEYPTPNWRSSHAKHKVGSPARVRGCINSLLQQDDSSDYSIPSATNSGCVAPNYNCAS
jgi:hypothetical protein